MFFNFSQIVASEIAFTYFQGRDTGDGGMDVRFCAYSYVSTRGRNRQADYILRRARSKTIWVLLNEQL
ncbi:MAG: hypothetical protein OEM91_08560 [Hyphomicrobiales bacterium]|nr:hypothetical protein [Hyphomicrobiales bacterium]